ncbi:MAG TPA: aminoacetone oxidase family FAD-binding enzyme [Saprospirales bacterium]|nr:aminoacetone oxidase family FAD-binding enzyme [Saprospirales bacterium]
MTDIAVIGGGAAGFFAAITAAESNPDCRITIFERGKNVLEKVRISGGGRCNVTHACFDARELVKNYPRGSRELLGPFMQFGPEQTVDWFEKRGVVLKTEADGRMFPVTDDSQTIVDCLERAAFRAGVQVRTSTRVDQMEPLADGSWRVGTEVFHKVMLASGSNPAIWEKLRLLGHNIIPPVPSLFTFNTKDSRLRDLSGVSVQDVLLRIPGTKLSARGPLLITHWGLSGPAVLRLSAWGARDLFAMGYKFPLVVSFTADQHPDEVMGMIQKARIEFGKKQVANLPLAAIPTRLWQHLTEAAGVTQEKRWADLGKTALQALHQQITAANFSITGKSTFKEEFVTAGGVSLKELNFKSFESKLCPNLFMAGEVLDIDAITGGFNFQAAWTGGRLAGLAMAHVSD